MSDIKANIENIKRIVKSMQNDKNPVEIIAVTKTFGADSILEALNCGINHIGESKIQEALPKFQELNGKLSDITKHFIGHLQSNKARKAVENFDLIQSLDSLELAKNIDKYANDAGKAQKCLIEVKISNEPSKTGIAPQDLDSFCSRCLNFPNILVKGLMLIAPLSASLADTRACFKQGFKLFEKLKSESFNILSMGMSDDYKIALEEGANMVRIGSAIFGHRDYSNK